MRGCAQRRAYCFCTAMRIFFQFLLSPRGLQLIADVISLIAKAIRR